MGRRRKGLQIITGAFPNVEVPQCDIFLALDVLEHVPDPVAFLRKAHNILRTGGIAILQQPTVRLEAGYELDPPFGEEFKRIFDDVEHLWIFTTSGIMLLAESTNFHLIDESSRWRQCHEVVVLRKNL